MLGIVQKIKREFPGTAIILFGSKAKGESHIYSDIDLLLLTTQKVDCRLREKISRLLYDFELEYDINIDPLIISKFDWESDHYRNHPLHEGVNKEGIIL